MIKCLNKIIEKIYNLKHIQNTIFGGLGFIGSNLCQSLKKDSLPYQIISRQDSLPTGNLGNVFYCAGITADFRSRPFDTIDAHVSTLASVLENCQFFSFTYLSSARMYRKNSLTTEETKFTIDPLEPEDLADVSKLTGEALCLSMKDKRVRVVRPSNVFGKDFLSKNFLTEIIEAALITKKIALRSALDSSKDYVDVDSVVNIMRRISERGTHRIYNIASGYNISHQSIVQLLRDLTGCKLSLVDDATSIIWPAINIDRIQLEFCFKSLNLMDELETLVRHFKSHLLKENRI